jgi:hypothetical protein
VKVKSSIDDVSREVLAIQDNDRKMTMLVDKLPGLGGEVTDIHMLLSSVASTVKTIYDELPEVTGKVVTGHDELLSKVRDALQAFHIDQAQRDSHDQIRRVRLWLRPSAFEDEQRRRKKERIEGTNEWFFEHSLFKDWTDLQIPVENCRLLWVYGKPGCGKSILASSVVLQLQNLGLRPIYFFFNSKSGNTVNSSPLGFVRTLLFQLLEVDDQLLNPLLTAYTKSGTAEASSFDALWEVFRVWCFRQPNPIFCVIDALDEALDGCMDPDDFLATIVDTVNQCKMLRICITSRSNHKIASHFVPNADIDDSSSDSEDQPPLSSTSTAVTSSNRFSQVFINENQVSSDLRQYIMTKIKTSRKFKSWISQSNIETLCARAEGMFLWYVYCISRLRTRGIASSSLC